LASEEIAMDMTQERVLNQDAYRRLKDMIGRTYGQGRFVAISGGQIVADADQFDELRSLLKALGKDPAQVLIVQAGIDYPETAVILSLVQASR
jgi:hypothetical protein